MTASTGCSWNAEAERRRRRVRWEVRGRVQGVGFRPFVHRLATQLGLSGWVANSTAGAVLELEGEERDLALFRQALVQQLPYPGQVEQIRETDSADLGHLPPSPASRPRFAIRPSQETGPAKPCLPPDLAPCPECVRELFDPGDRRYRYPFLSCPACGPRFSIVRALPFDRARTSLAAFPLCAACRSEYDDPGNRRFHGQTIACPRCGPRLILRTPQGSVVASGEEALGRTEETLRRGGIVALKGMGGFQLLVDARDEDAVRRLRQRKNRPAKPLALLVPDLVAAHRLCHLDATEQQILASPQAPIVLLHRRPEAEVAASVAPDLPWLGLMLPATPLHHLLARDLGFPLVATSGNRSEEPLCISDEEALDRLASIADLILTHDRDIVRPLDDSVVQVVLGRIMVLRRARGLVPEPVPLAPCRPGVWALGGHLKSTFAMALDGAAMLSQHLGDLDTPLARRGLARALEDYRDLFQAPASLVVRDLHPDYASTLAAHELADRASLPLLAVQHHEAHVWACLAEHNLLPGPSQGENDRADAGGGRTAAAPVIGEPGQPACGTAKPILGVAWDGTGYGTDGQIWGGEFFAVVAGRCQRVGHFLAFPLPGGEAAVRHPWRSALGALWTAAGEALWQWRHLPFLQGIASAQMRILMGMMRRGVQSPRTTSVGRLFDAVAAILGLCLSARYEGEAALRLQAAAAQVPGPLDPFPVVITGEGVVDWRPMLQAVLAEAVAAGDDAAGGVIQPRLAIAAARFQETLATVVEAFADRLGCEAVVLGGGCFQNRDLLRSIVSHVEAAGRRVYWPQAVPPNDGGLSFGQLAAVAARKTAEEQACAWPCPDRSSA